MRLVGLDPSSTLTGYAVMDGPDRLIDAGLLKPKCQKDPAILRIITMASDLRELLKETKPDVVAVEITSGKVADKKRARSMGAGLAVYGMAVGMMYDTAYSLLGFDMKAVIPVQENIWTRGVPKQERLALMMKLFPQYTIDQDPGGDMGDAINIGVWTYEWLEAQELIAGGMV